MTRTRLTDRSFGLPTGASAQSAPTCVDPADATLRLFTINTGSSLSPLEGDAVHADAFGVTQTAPIALVTGGGSSQPTYPIPIPEVADDVVYAPLVPGGDPIGSRQKRGLLRFPLGGGATSAPRW